MSHRVLATAGVVLASWVLAGAEGPMGLPPSGGGVVRPLRELATQTAQPVAELPPPASGKDKRFVRQELEKIDAKDAASAARAEKALVARGPTGFVKTIRIQPDRNADCSSIKSVVESVTKGCRTNDEKAIALFDFMLATYYHCADPGDHSLGALRSINVYGWGLCGNLHTIIGALWREAGWRWRYVGWKDPGHTSIEVEYDGAWHYFDVFLKFYAWRPDPKAPGGRTVASQEDIKKAPKLVTEQFVLDKERGAVYFKNRLPVSNGKVNWLAPAFLSCGDTMEGIIKGIGSSWTPDWGLCKRNWDAVAHEDPPTVVGYTTDVNLAPGYRLTLDWSDIDRAYWYGDIARRYIPAHGCGDRDYRNCPISGPLNEPYRERPVHRTTPNMRISRTYSTAILDYEPDMAKEAFMTNLAAMANAKWSDGAIVPTDTGRPASITIRLPMPYAMAKGTGSAEGVQKAELSVDYGKTFKEVNLADFSEGFGKILRQGEPAPPGLHLPPAIFDCQLRLTTTTALRNIQVQIMGQANRGALPYLSPGRNVVSVTAADAAALGENRLMVTYSYSLGWRDKSYDDMLKEGKRIADGQYAHWSREPTVVRKLFSAKDLPAQWTIDLLTPKDKFPAYPRMHYMKREILPACRQPEPLPDATSPPAGVPGAELKELPSPFRVGITRP